MHRLLALALLMGTAASQGDAEFVTWRTDLDKARAEARRTGKPLLAVFR